MHMYTPRIRLLLDFLCNFKIPIHSYISNIILLFSQNYHHSLHKHDKYLMLKFPPNLIFDYSKTDPLQPELRNIVINLSLNALQGTWKYRASVPPSVRSCWHSHVYNSCQIFMKLKSSAMSLTLSKISPDQIFLTGYAPLK